MVDRVRGSRFILLCDMVSQDVVRMRFVCDVGGYDHDIGFDVAPVGRGLHGECAVHRGSVRSMELTFHAKCRS